ncbi:rhomboid family intramembrane serine protease [Pseudoflavitalea sp. X16]|uniref:rhomboid family intramembrane serine protease n=1 Tax=Paraflavitalea devenefica TaxID=2716334 RepID=UPI00141DE508|nr:rhomboid family intramembrane serine protease [Paraflavitalea devenefica]NII28856.1 rhomboid family intramembrane serine protease [Paraflavitalea devenefica]
MIETFDVIPDTNPFRKYFPLVTAACCLLCVILYVGINFEENKNTWEAYGKWGALSSADIFNGGIWSLFTSAFLHLEVWQIGFNLYWFWVLGKKIEFESGKPFYILLIVTAAFVGSVVQLSFSDSPGIGLAGVDYALFGYIYIKGKLTPEYKDYLNRVAVITLFGWIILCFVLARTNTWNLATGMLIGGLLWGMALAYLSKYNKLTQWALAISLIVVLTSTVFWSPFSTSWLAYRAYNLHQEQKLDEAVRLYKVILERDANNEFAKVNLKQLEVHKLEEQAHELQKKGQLKEARAICEQIIIKDANNTWAREMLEILPAQ